jgi:hypothetical protein
MLQRRIKCYKRGVISAVDISGKRVGLMVFKNDVLFFSHFKFHNNFVGKNNFGKNDIYLTYKHIKSNLLVEINYRDLKDGSESLFNLGRFLILEKKDEYKKEVFK